MVPFKKHLTFLVLILGLFSGLMAHPVDQEMAKAIAVKFMGTDRITLSSTYRTTNNDPAFYIFNTIDGFVIVSADDCETPIIGYSHESRFNPNDIPIQMEDYLRDFAERIQYGIDNQIVADETTAKQWELVKATGRLNDNKSAKAVEPLLTTKWHQGCLYNSLCPEISGPCGHAEVGCVAVAMGQIMNYWQHPTIGYGNHSYNGTGTMLTADFGNTEYDWNHMPDSLTEASSEEEIEAVATLLFHCGVSVDMMYTTSGSGAQITNIPYALTWYFRYSNSLHLDQFDNDLDGWLTKLKNCINQERPVLYSGQGSNGHAFVCDGYDENDLFHFNWGWGGNGDGYFAIGNLNPTGHNYNSNNRAIFDIFPQEGLYQVTGTVYPPQAGSVVGSGAFTSIEDTCTLTAIPTETTEFLYWKENGNIVSYDSIFSFSVLGNRIIEANFTFKTPKLITASLSNNTNNPNSTFLSLTWNYVENGHWNLLKQFTIGPGERNIASDGNYIYTCRGYNSNDKARFFKYSMEGELIEYFDFNGIYSPSCLTYDGNYFYCNGSTIPSTAADKLFCIDLDNQTIVGINDFHTVPNNISYDPVYDGFWITRNERHPKLVDRNGQTIKTIPTTLRYIRGLGFILANDGNSHLLLLSIRNIYDYDINNNTLPESPMKSYSSYPNGVFVGKYLGKDAVYLASSGYNGKVRIYDITGRLSQIIGYRIYRIDANGTTMVLSDLITDNTYIDLTWSNTPNGIYRFGVSSVFSNGNESNIVWSEPIEQTNFDGIEEKTKPTGQNIQKIFENGQIVIIKDGKKYNITGQEIKR